MSPPQPLSLLTSKVHEKQVTFDVTSSASVPPEAFAPSPLLGGQALGYAVVNATFSTAEAGNTANAMVASLPAPPQDGQVSHYRFVAVTNGTFMAGVSAPETFKDSWGMRGISLNGSNGGLVAHGLIKSDFSIPFNEKGTMVDWFMEVHGSAVDVFIALNGRPLGHAFSLDFSKIPDTLKRLAPSMSVSCDDGPGEVQIAIIQFESRPISAAYRGRRSEPDDPTRLYVGKWVPTPAEWAGLSFPPGANLNVLKDRIVFKVANVQSAGVSFEPSGALRVVGVPISTRMMPLPPFDLTEQAVGKFLTTLKSWRLDNDNLVLEAADGPKTFSRDDGTQGLPAHTENPFIVTH